MPKKHLRNHVFIITKGSSPLLLASSLGSYILIFTAIASRIVWHLNLNITKHKYNIIFLTSNKVTGIHIPLQAKRFIRYLRSTQGSWFSYIQPNIVSFTTEITNVKILWREITGKVRKSFKQLLPVRYKRFLLRYDQHL